MNETHSTHTNKPKKSLFSVGSVIVAITLAIVGWFVVYMTFGYQTHKTSYVHSFVRDTAYYTAQEDQQMKDELSSAKAKESFAYAIVFALPVLYLYLRYRKIQRQP